MKRSKIFLGATTALLAVVGVVGAKAHKAFTTNKTFFTANSACSHAYSAAVTTRGPQNPVGVTKEGSSCIGKVVYTGEQ